MEKEWGGETLGDPRLELGAEREMGFEGGGIICAIEGSWAMMPAAAAAAAATCCLLPRLEFGLLCILECLVSSSDRLKRFEHPGNEQACGFSPVWVRMWRVWCSRRWKAFSHRGHL